MLNWSQIFSVALLTAAYCCYDAGSPALRRAKLAGPKARVLLSLRSKAAPQLCLTAQCKVASFCPEFLAAQDIPLELDNFLIKALATQARHRRSLACDSHLTCNHAIKHRVALECPRNVSPGHDLSCHLLLLGSHAPYIYAVSLLTLQRQEVLVKQVCTESHSCIADVAGAESGAVSHLLEERSSQLLSGGWRLLEESLSASGHPAWHRQFAAERTARETAGMHTTLTSSSATTIKGAEAAVCHDACVDIQDQRPAAQMDLSYAGLALMAFFCECRVCANGSR